LEAHRHFLDRYYASGHFLCSGPQNPRVGGVILCKAKNRDEIDPIIKEDPFFANGVASYEVIEFNPNKTIDALKGII
ncbi:MAG: YciI family protein, partial [Bacteroidota bacterium]|nr:YciI family protein [Bacteroidota bacterium]